MYNLIVLKLKPNKTFVCTAVHDIFLQKLIFKRVRKITSMQHDLIAVKIINLNKHHSINNK